MKILPFFLIALLNAGFCKAQPCADSAVNIAHIIQDSNVASKTLLYIDSTASLSIRGVLKKNFRPLVTYKSLNRLRPASVIFTYFLKIPVCNNTGKEVSVYLYPGYYFKEIQLEKLNTQTATLQHAGHFSGYGKLTLAAGEACNLIIRLQPLKCEFNNIASVLIHKNFINYHKKINADSKSNLHVFGAIISGVLFMMMLFMITNFVIAFKPEFLYNALYSFCMFLLVIFNSIVPKQLNSFTNFYYSYLDFFLLVSGTVFYIRFIRKFLDTNLKYKLLDTLLKYGELLIILFLIIYSYLNFFTSSYQPQYYLENIVKFLILAVGVMFILLALRLKDRLFNYIASGNAMLVLFSVVSLIFIIYPSPIIKIYTSPIFYYDVGIVLELFFFLLGLTYKNRSELITGIKEQEELKLEAKKQEFETQIAVIKAQQEERNRISADMHDDLGAGMTTISLYSELAKGKLKNNPLPEIDKISSSANELLNKMNAIIWSMSSSNDTLSNLIAYIRIYALEYFENTGINCKISIPENLPNVEVVGEIRRNVFMVVKEALNNILKHAKATEVSITLTRVEDGLTLYIHDNGRGINLDNLRQFGNGLKNMKKRMQDIEVDFSIENKNGTLIILHRKITTY